MKKNDDPNNDNSNDNNNDSSNKTNTWNLILKHTSLTSIWIQNKLLNHDGTSTDTTTKKFPVSVNKMRGPSSNQPDKIGEHQCELIDHIFTNARSSVLHQQPKFYKDKKEAETELYPSKQMPSDHLPIVVNISLR